MEATNITKIVEYRLAQEIEKHTTWHILHAILTMFTGVWFLGWIFLTSHRREKRLTAFRHAEALYRGVAAARDVSELRSNPTARPALKFFDLD